VFLTRQTFTKLNLFHVQMKQNLETAV